MKVAFRRVKRVVGVVEGRSVGLNGFRTEHSVVHHPFHAVAIAGIAGDPQQILRNFEVSIGAAGCFKAGANAVETLAELPAARHNEMFARARSASGVALLLHHGECVPQDDVRAAAFFRKAALQGNV